MFYPKGFPYISIVKAKAPSFPRVFSWPLTIFRLCCNAAPQDSADKGKISEMRKLAQLRKAAEGARLQAKRAAASNGELKSALATAFLLTHDAVFRSCCC
jgi:hypothetical protein